MKNILVSGYIGFNNFGDEAIFYALQKHLKSLGYNVGVLSGNKVETSEKYNVSSYSYNNIQEIIFAITKSDVLISGGGSLLQNNTSNLSLYYYLFIILFAKLLFKQVIIFAQGIEPIRGKFHEFVFKKIIKLADFVSVRDSKSKNYLHKMSINSILLTDPVYSMLQDIPVSQSKSGLIIQLRKSKKITDNFIKNLALQISKNFNKDIKILSLQDTFDIELCKKLQNELNLLNVPSQLIANASIEETVKIINDSEFMISTRLHGAIVSNALKTKTFTLNYDEKLKTFSEELNVQHINLDNYSYDSLNEKLDTFFNTKIDFSEYRRFEWNEIDSALNKFLGV